MTYSVALVCRALEALNEPPIDTLEDLDSLPGSVLKILGADGANYWRTMGRVLKGIGRGSFIVHATLSPLSIAGDPKFPYRFQMPEGGLVFLDPPCGLGLELGIDVVGDVEQRTLRASDASPIDISYVKRVDPDLLEDEVFEALGLGLAATVAYQVTAQRDWADRVEAKAAEAISKARAAMASSTESQPQRRGRMGRVRGGARR